MIPDIGPIEASVWAGLLVACYTDIRWWKIPNALTGVLLVVGLAMNATIGDVRASLIGLGLAFAIHYPLWLLGVQKGGDSKLMIALGAMAGAAPMVETTLWKFLLLIPVGGAILVATGNLANLRTAIAHLVARARGENPPEPPTLTYMPFAPVIAAGWGCASFTDWIPV